MPPHSKDGLRKIQPIKISPVEKERIKELGRYIGKTNISEIVRYAIDDSLGRKRQAEKRKKAKDEEK